MKSFWTVNGLPKKIFAEEGSEPELERLRAARSAFITEVA